MNFLLQKILEEYLLWNSSKMLCLYMCFFFFFFLVVTAVARVG